tara:strand:- start:4288 stop:4650 length:363 start_codon:yes stop_codon:yes gene_type:complete
MFVLFGLLIIKLKTMNGNIYICLNEETYKSNIPEILDNGNPITFEDMGAKNKELFGGVNSIVVNDENFYILEMSASWIKGEVSSLLALGEGLEFPSNALLSNKEAREIIQDNTDFSDLKF